MSVIEASRRGKKQGNYAELNFEALLEPCRLLLLEDFLNASIRAIIKIFILVDEAPLTLGPWSKLPHGLSLSAALSFIPSFHY